MGFFILAVFLGLIPASIAQNKGRNFILWWFFGTMVLILALPLSLILKPVKEPEKESIRITKPIIEIDLDSKKCPFCAENIKLAAIICRYCGQDLITNKEDHIRTYVLK